MAGYVDLIKVLVQGPEGPKDARARIDIVSDDGTIGGQTLATALVEPGAQSYFDFQFLPETVQDNIQINYSDIELLGLSHPMKNWTSNGGRTISFDALFSRDIKPQADLPPENRVVDPTDAANIEDNIDVAWSIACLRRLCAPRKGGADGSVQFAKAPPVLALTLTGMGLAANGGDTVFVVMTTCDVEYLRTFRDGRPRLARVGLEFAEVIQVGGEVRPTWDTDFEDAIRKWSREDERGNAAAFFRLRGERGRNA